MHDQLRIILLAGLMAMTGPAFAQDAPAAGATPAEDAPATQAPATEGDNPSLDMGQPVGQDAPTDDAGPQPGQPYVRSEHGDWLLRCLDAEDDAEEPCQLYQLLEDDEGNAVAEISMFPLPAGGQAVAGATIVVPLETLLTQQLRLSVDGGEQRRYPFTFCNRAGCVARVGFTAAEVDQFRRGNAGQLILVPAAAPDQEVRLGVSLSGFTAGFAQATSPVE